VRSRSADAVGSARSIDGELFFVLLVCSLLTAAY